MGLTRIEKSLMNADVSGDEMVNSPFWMGGPWSCPIWPGSCGRIIDGDRPRISKEEEVVPYPCDRADQGRGWRMFEVPSSSAPVLLVRVTLDLLS